MNGANKLIIGSITQSKTRGKALVNALSSAFKKEPTASPKKGNKKK